jgi:hypothetical protein
MKKIKTMKDLADKHLTKKGLTKPKKSGIEALNILAEQQHTQRVAIAAKKAMPLDKKKEARQAVIADQVRRNDEYFASKRYKNESPAKEPLFKPIVWPGVLAFRRKD